MNIRDALQKILSEWLDAKNETFGGHELAGFIRDDLVRIALGASGGFDPALIFKGSPGQGNWAEVPWLAVMHPHITESTTHGVYPVFLFRADASGVYLTLGQGTTDPKRDYGAIRAWELLSKRAEKLRAQIPELGEWKSGMTDLRASSTLGKSYEKPNIGYKFYSSDELPSAERITDDLNSLLRIYNKVVQMWESFGSLESYDSKSLDLSESLEIDFPLDISKCAISFARDVTGIMNIGLFLNFRYVCSLCTKKFLLLTGLSGSGKTKLAQAFSTWISESEDQANLIAVGADWTSNENLLGYPDALNPGQYRKPDNGVLDLILNARNDDEHPYFLILDEMNLSHVERYFADFLSAMESGEPIHLHADEPGDWDGVPAKLSIPKNLFVIGTVNVDETTYMFSPKVLDRANVIEFRVEPEEMSAFLENPVKPDLDSIAGQGTAYAKAFTAAAKRKDVELDTETREAVEKVLMDFFTPLQAAGAEFGYRTAHEICRFVYFHKELSGEAWEFNTAMDAAVMQKLLPKLHGSKKKLGPVLETMMRLCLVAPPEKDDPLKEEHFTAENVRYPVSLKKLQRMQDRLVQQGFTSFAEA